MLNSLKLKLRKNGEFLYVKGSPHRVKVPSMNEKFCLFLGMLWGDGWIVRRDVAERKSQWRIGIVEDDKKLIKTFKTLVKEILGIEAKILDRKTKYEVYFNSRIIYEILNRVFEFPDGKKKGKLKIPSIILHSNRLICSFLKGLFSTDGSIVFSQSYPRIVLDSATLTLIEDVKKALKNLGFNPRVSVWNRRNGSKLYRLHLNGWEQTLLFYRKINFIGEKANKLKKYITNSPGIAPSRAQTRGI